MAKKKTEEKPKCCGECARFWRTAEDPNMGGCDEFATAGIYSANNVCHPNIGRKGTPRTMKGEK